MGLDKHAIKCFIESRQAALADWLDCEFEDIKYLGDYDGKDDARFLYDEEEYLVLTEAEAKEYAAHLAEEILDEKLKGVDKSMIHNYFDSERWIKDYVEDTGCGPIISAYDGMEWIVYSLIGGDSEWEYPPVCCECGYMHDYMVITPGVVLNGREYNKSDMAALLDEIHKLGYPVHMYTGGNDGVHWFRAGITVADKSCIKEFVGREKNIWSSLVEAVRLLEEHNKTKGVSND